MSFFCSSIKVFSHVKNWSNVFSLAPSHPKWTSLSEFLITTIRWSKLSTPSWNHQRFVITLVTFKFFSVSIYEPTMPSTWWTKNDTCKNCILYVAHHLKGFLVFTNHMHNCQNIWVHIQCWHDGIININNLPKK